MKKPGATAIRVCLCVLLTCAAVRSAEPGRPFAYVTNEHHNVLTVIDVATNTVTDTIPLSIGSADVALSPDGGLAYLADTTANRVTIVDTMTRTVVGRIPVGNYPTRVAISGDGRWAYVVGYPIVRIDLRTYTTTSLISLPQAFGVAVSPAGLFDYVVGLDDQGYGLFVIDNSTNEVTKLLPNFFAGGITLSADGRLAYVVGYPLDYSLHSVVQIIDTASLTVLRKFDLNDSICPTLMDHIVVSPDGRTAYLSSDQRYLQAICAVDLTRRFVRVRRFSGATGLAISHDGRTLYSTSRPESQLAIFDIDTGKVTTPFPFGTHPEGIAFAPDDALVYVAADDALYIVDRATNAVVAKIPGASDPTGIALAPDGRFAYVANNFSGSVSIVDTETRSIVGVSTGGQPLGVAITPDGRSAYVTSSDFPGHVYVIDTATQTQTAALDAPGPTGGIAITPDGSKVYVSNFAAHTVSVIDAATNTVTKMFHPGAIPLGISLHPTAGFGYIGSYNGAYLPVLDTSIDQVVTSVTLNPGGGQPCAGVFTPDGEFAYVVDRRGDHVFAIKSLDKNVAWTATLGLTYASDSCGVAVTPDARFVYVANHDNDAVTVIDAQTHQIAQQIPVDEAPYEIKIACLGGCPSPTPTPTDTPTPTPTGTPTPGPCFGDCDHSGIVTVDELVTAVNIALGTLAPSTCPELDSSHDGEVTVDEVVQAVNAALIGCQGLPGAQARPGSIARFRLIPTRANGSCAA